MCVCVCAFVSVCCTGLLLNVQPAVIVCVRLSQCIEHLIACYDKRQRKRINTVALSDEKLNWKRFNNYPLLCLYSDYTH